MGQLGLIKHYLIDGSSFSFVRTGGFELQAGGDANFLRLRQGGLELAIVYRQGVCCPTFPPRPGSILFAPPD